jgi:hypothetical protein
MPIPSVRITRHPPAAVPIAIAVPAAKIIQ